MKKVLIFSFLVVFLMTAFSVDVEAQYKGKKKKKKKTTTERNSEYFDESGGDILSKLWYGSDVTIGLNGGDGTTQFSFGLSPMVGYKITENFSVGPKITGLYTSFRIDIGTNEDLKANAFNYGAGIFARHKILQTYFVHAEVEHLSEEFAFFNNLNQIETIREGNSHYYLGGGYISGGSLISFSGYALWDFSQELSANNIPIVARIGITYKF